MAKEIHPTAIIDSEAVIDKDVSIGPFCILKGKVSIKRGTTLVSNVMIEGKTEIGEGCMVYPFTSIGLPPQDLKYKNEETGVAIGNGNVIREYTTIHRASVSGDGLTVVGDHNFLMAYVHIAHDCKIGNHIIMSNVATLAGHVTVDDYAFIGGLVAVHQFTRIGVYAMVGGFSGIGQDIPPYTVASGARARLYGLNTVGLKRHGFSDSSIRALKKAYKIIFREKKALKDAIKKIRAELPDTEEIRNLIEFIEKNKRGVCR
ncbi:MAG TPA: acyl-[acyl-carrier-protein]--UDP-N-acetylglucosamine O-acyltransferase [Nitrospiraceae bacterium]|jgi:UDP-N-acetylglucosamine acyltransferase|nr:acyl-[acyl-carrier-protein]--UDP-N-acetylglucosamine O-acyltransferase [Nitrospiraceae bacterium]